MRIGTGILNMPYLTINTSSDEKLFKVEDSKREVKQELKEAIKSVLMKQILKGECFLQLRIGAGKQ